jgi:O-antigen ligase
LNTAQVVQLVILSSAAMLLALGAVTVVVLASDASRRTRTSFFPWIFPIIAMAMAFGPLTSQRNLSLVTPFFEASYDEIGVAKWVSRIFVIAALVIASERIFTFVVNRRRIWPAGSLLLTGVLAVNLTHYVLAAFLGERSSFSFFHLYPFFLFPAAYLCAHEDRERCNTYCKATLLWFLLASAAVAAARPELVVQFRYTEGLIPGVSLRYWGLGSHANSLGPLALLFLLCIAHRPFRLRFVQWFSVVLGLASLVGTQSKTMWGAALVAFAILALVRILPRLAADWRKGRLSLAFVLALGVAAMAALGVFVVALGLGNNLWSSRLTEFAQANNVTTLTGRSRIWALALDDFWRNPLFGYGPAWGDLEYRISRNAASAVHAHNQLVHSAGSAGAFGLMATAAYLVLLVVFAARAFHRSDGFSAALVAVILVHSVTEVPLLTRGLASPAMMWQLLTFVVLVGYARARAPVAARGEPAASTPQTSFSIKLS